LKKKSTKPAAASSGWVLDSSFALAWALPDEASDKVDSFWREVKNGRDIWVPSLWWFETGNALVMARRRKRITDRDALDIIRLFSRLPLLTDTLADGPALQRFFYTAQASQISAYDAAYLELALRRGLGLATLDTKLKHAAEDSGIAAW